MAEPKSPDGSLAGDPIPPNYALIQIRVRELRQLFHTIDPSPFDERDLDPDAEEFIVSWAKEVPKSAKLCLLVHLERSAGSSDEAQVLGDAVRQFFTGRASVTR